MAVEIEIRISSPYEPSILASRVAKELQEWLQLESEPYIEIHVESTNSLGYPAMRLRIGDSAEISVAPYTSRSDSTTWACISYAPLRTCESKALCLATAVVLAKINDTSIQDESNLFHRGNTINPHQLLVSLDATSGPTDFRTQAALAIQCMEDQQFDSD